MNRNPARPSRLRAAALLALLAVAGAGVACSSRKIHYTAVAVVRPEGGIGSAAGDAALLAHQSLLLTPNIPVSLDPAGRLDRTVFRLGPVAASADPQAALEAARSGLAGLPRTFRRRAVRTWDRLGFPSLDPQAAAMLAAALRARFAGDPMAAGAALGDRRAGEPPVVAWVRGASRLDAGDLAAGAENLREGGGEAGWPGGLSDLSRAASSAAAGRRPEAVKALDAAIGSLPSLPEARQLRARMERVDCSIFDAPGIFADLQAALVAHPCSPLVALDSAAMESFAGHPGEGSAAIERGQGCAQGPLDAARARAQALLRAADGRRAEAGEAAAVAESRDASALLPGLAEAYLLLGDPGRLHEAYDSESDARLAPSVAAAMHLNSGLAHLWLGRGSEAAVQFERAEEKYRALESGPDGFPAASQLAAAFRIRAFLVAGRVPEAGRAAAESLAVYEDSTGLLTYAAALAEIAGGDAEGALRRTQALTGAPQKLWRWLIHAESQLAAGRPSAAADSVRLAFLGVGQEISVCPGIPADPYILSLNARTLSALGRTADSRKILERVTTLGPRGVHAPDILVPAWLLLGEVLEAEGDTAGATRAYERVLEAWGSGDEGAVTGAARRRLEALGKTGGTAATP